MRTLLLISFLGLSGCATSPFCTAARPIQLDRAAAEDLVAADLEGARAIGAHNLTGRELCGWDV